DGSVIGRLAEPGPGDFVARWSPDNSYLALGNGASGRIQVWRLAGETPARVLDDAGRWSSAFSPDSRRIAVRQADDAIVLFDLATGLRVRRLPPMPAHSMVFHPERDWLALGSPNLIQVRDVRTGKVLRERHGYF